MFSKIFLAVAVAAMAVSAQDTTTTSSAASSTALAGISPCVIACIGPAAQLNNCTSITDVECVCSSAQFQADAAQCLAQHCTSSDLAAALALQTSQCTAAGISPTGTATTPNSVPFTLASSSTAAGGSSTTGSAATTTGAATTGAATTSGAATTPTTPATSAGTSAGTAATTSATSGANAVVAKQGAIAFIGAAIAGALVL